MVGGGEREWYALHAIAGGWSRHTLQQNVKNRLKQRRGAALTNFATRFPVPQSALAQETLKDPYLFDFLGLAVKLLIAPRKSSANHHDAPFPDPKSQLGQMRSVVSGQTV